MQKINIPFVLAFAFFIISVPLFVFSIRQQQHSDTNAQFYLTPIPSGSITQYNSMSAVLEQNKATFSFRYIGNAHTYLIDLSTVSDMSSDVYLNFAGWGVSPIVELNPQKWAKYTCGRTMYWRIHSNLNEYSPVSSVVIKCSTNLTPTAIKVPTISRLPFPTGPITISPPRIITLLPTRVPTPTPTRKLTPTPTRQPTLTPRPNFTPAPFPVSPNFSNQTAVLTQSAATFKFNYSGQTTGFLVYVANSPDSTTSWHGFIRGSQSPVIKNSPLTDPIYRCGEVLWWWVEADNGDKSNVTAANISCSITPTPTRKPTPTPTKKPTPTRKLTSTPTSVPTLLPTMTLTPNGMKIAVNILLHGIGRGGDNMTANGIGNMNPLHPQRTVTIDLYNVANEKVATINRLVQFNSSDGNFTGIFDLGQNIQPGSYYARFDLQQYLSRRSLQIFQLNSNQTTNISELTFITGDTDNNNRLDILDYNKIVDCFSELLPPKNCADPVKKMDSDITDDGQVSQYDYNLFLRELSTQSGE